MNTNAKPIVLVVDDDGSVRATLKVLLEQADYAVRDYPSAVSCLDSDLTEARCLISDIRMPTINGLQFLEAIGRRQIALPVIFITGHADVQLAVEAMKAGAVDFIEKPFQADVILRSVRTALSAGEEAQSRQAETKMWQERLCQLTPREREVLEHLVAGKTHKVAARELGISYRTVEVHRAHIMEKLKANGISDLVRIVLKAPQPFLSQSASGACLASG